MKHSGLIADLSLSRSVKASLLSILPTSTPNQLSDNVCRNYDQTHTSPPRAGIGKETVLVLLFLTFVTQ